MIYNILCLIMIGAGAGIVLMRPPMEYPLLAVLAILLIALGLFLLAFKGKSNDKILEGLENTNPWWWPWGW